MRKRVYCTPPSPRPVFAFEIPTVLLDYLGQIIVEKRLVGFDHYAITVFRIDIIDLNLTRQLVANNNLFLQLVFQGLLQEDFYKFYSY